MYYVLIILLGYLHKRYTPYLPGINTTDNITEAKKVLQISKKRTQSDINFFKLTDISVSSAFKEYGSVKNLDKIITETWIQVLIPSLKTIINRARPYQINKKIKRLKSKTGNTGSLPSGHAFQAYYLAYILSKKYPKDKKKLNSIAQRCDTVRVKAGIHYPSDGKLSKDMVYFLFNYNFI